MQAKSLNFCVSALWQAYSFTRVDLSWQPYPRTIYGTIEAMKKVPAWSCHGCQENHLWYFNGSQEIHDGFFMVPKNTMNKTRFYHNRWKQLQNVPVDNWGGIRVFCMILVWLPRKPFMEFQWLPRNPWWVFHGSQEHHEQNSFLPQPVKTAWKRTCWQLRRYPGFLYDLGMNAKKTVYGISMVAKNSMMGFSWFPRTREHTEQNSFFTPKIITELKLPKISCGYNDGTLDASWNVNRYVFNFF